MSRTLLETRAKKTVVSNESRPELFWSRKTPKKDGLKGCFRSEGKFLYSLAPADPDVLQFWSKKACSEISLEGWRGAKKFPRKCNKGKSLRRPFLETFSGDKPCFSGDNSSDIDALKRGFWRHFLETISFTWRHFPFLATFLATFPLSETL